MQEQENVKKEEFLYSNSGSKYYKHIDYKYSLKDKCMVPYEKDAVNQYEMIQASKSSCDINIIINRMKAGDLSVINVNPNAAYMDISEIPNNINDANEMINNSIETFNSLHPAIKTLFNNDYLTMAEAIQNGTYEKIISDFGKALNEKKVEEPKEEK